MEILASIVIIVFLAVPAAAIWIQIFASSSVLNRIIAAYEKRRIHKKMEEIKKSGPVRTCPFSCESYRRGMIGKRFCLAGRWDERRSGMEPVLLAETLEPVVPYTCGILKGDALLEGIFENARRRGWR